MLQLSRELAVNYRTAVDLTRKFRAGIDSEVGSTLPYALISRAAWSQIRTNVGGGLRAANWRKPDDIPYPYLPNDTKSDGAELVLFVNNLVPRGLPNEMRADVCQDLLVGILAGEIAREAISKDVKKYITQAYQAAPWKYKWLSFETPLREDSDRTLADIISAEDAADRFNWVNT